VVLSFSFSTPPFSCWINSEDLVARIVLFFGPLLVCMWVADFYLLLIYFFSVLVICSYLYTLKMSFMLSKTAGIPLERSFFFKIGLNDWSSLSSFIFLLGLYPTVYSISWIPGLINRLLQAAKHPSYFFNCVQVFIHCLNMQFAYQLQAGCIFSQGIRPLGVYLRVLCRLH